jgi:hypothetical protein
VGKKGRAPRTDHVCVICHKSFNGPTAMKCCSRECRAKYRAAGRTAPGEVAGYRPFRPNHRHCERCGSRLNYLNKGRLCLPCLGRRIANWEEGT